MMLLDEGECNVDFRNRDERFRTHMHQACRKGYLEIVKHLLTKSPKLNVPDNDGRTPIMDAAGGCFG